MSKVYLVERTDDNKGYDEYHNFVVVATSPARARELCMLKSADEGKGVWANAKVTNVGKSTFTEGILLGDFNAG